MGDLVNELDKWTTVHRKIEPSGVALTRGEIKEQRRLAWEALSPRQKRQKQLEREKVEIEHPEYNRALVGRAQRRMARVDSMPHALREVVYDFGLEIVQEFINHHVTNPKSIRHLIETCWFVDNAEGNPRFKINKSPGAKRNEAEYADVYFATDKTP